MTQDNTLQLPLMRYVRMAQIAGPIVPVCATTIWHRVRLGRFPQPFKLGERATAWRAEDIRARLDEQRAT